MVLPVVMDLGLKPRGKFEKPNILAFKVKKKNYENQGSSLSKSGLMEAGFPLNNRPKRDN